MENLFKARQMYLLFIVIMSVFLITGCGGGGDGKDTVLGSGDAVIAPRVTLVSPLNKATGVALNKSITATFSKEMDSATVTAAGTFTVAKTSDGIPIAGTVTYVAAGSTATFKPTSNLEADTSYTATISVAAKDLAGTPLAAAYTWTFRTALTLDVTAPTIISTGVADGAVGVYINRSSTATFSEPMDPATLASPAANFTVVKSIGGVPVVGGAVAGVVTYIDNTATFKPNVDLEHNTEYTSEILAGATDLAGNALVAGAVANPWSWTTGTLADTTAPTVTLTSPVDLASNVDLNKTVSATFSEEMDNSTITTNTFTLTPTATPASLVSGVVLYNPLTNIATFKPDVNLTASTNYTATITSGAKDLAGNALVVPAVGGLPVPNPWTFTTGTGLAPSAVDLKSAAPFGTFGGTAGITNEGVLTVINGDMGTTAASTLVTGFEDAVGDLYTVTPLNHGMVNGRIYTDAPPPGGAGVGGTAETMAIATQARLDAIDAFNELKLMSSDGVLAGNLAGLTINPGVYTNATSVLIDGANLTLDALGDADAVFVFQIGSTLTVGAAAVPYGVILAGGAQAKNVFWQVGTSATINPSGGGTMEGTIIAQSSVSFSTSGNVDIVTLNGRALALDAAVSMTNTVINVPAP